MSERSILVDLIEQGKEADRKLAELDKPIKQGDELSYGGKLFYTMRTKAGVFDVLNADGSDYGSGLTSDNYAENAYTRTGRNIFDLVGGLS